MFFRGIFEELLWFLRGQTDSKILEEKVNIWKYNSNKLFLDKIGLKYREGDIGNMYGFNGFIMELIIKVVIMIIKRKGLIK